MCSGFFDTKSARDLSRALGLILLVFPAKAAQFHAYRLSADVSDDLQAGAALNPVGIQGDARPEVPASRQRAASAELQAEALPDPLRAHAQDPQVQQALRVQHPEQAPPDPV